MNLEDIKSNVAKVISYSQNIENPLVNDLIDKWAKSKEWFIVNWGGPIYEVEEEITFELSDKDKKDRLEEFIAVIYDTYGNEALGEFLSATRTDFFQNHLSEDFVSDEGIRIPKGSKILRAFKFFETDKKIIYNLQTLASMIIQENKIKGKLCFSVHPLDFLSVSENTYHWRSCHALDGDYRAGNIGYMTDKATFVCYLKGADEVKLPRFPKDVPWNDKKWRMLGFFSDFKNTLFAGRQYPFFSDTALDIVRKELTKSLSLEPMRWTNFHEDLITKVQRKGAVARSGDENLFGPYVPIHNHIYRIQDMIIDHPNSNHFNDLLESSFYTPRYAWRRRTWWDTDPYDEPPKVHIGDEVTCLCCGQAQVGGPSIMRCYNCESKTPNPSEMYFARCECCDSTVRRSELVYNNSCDGWICKECAKLESMQCENCKELWFKCDIVYNRDYKEFRCPQCMEYTSKSSNPIEITFDEEDLPF